MPDSSGGLLCLLARIEILELLKGRKSIPRFSEVDENGFLAQANFLWEDPSKYARL
jgi:hypothetical protein